MVRRGELTHLSLSLPVSICGSWPSFMGWALVVICGQSSSFVGGHLHFLTGHGGGAVIGGHGHSWVVTKGSGGDEHGWQH